MQECLFSRTFYYELLILIETDKIAIEVNGQCSPLCFNFNSSFFFTTSERFIHSSMKCHFLARSVSHV